MRLFNTAGESSLFLQNNGTDDALIVWKQTNGDNSYYLGTISSNAGMRLYDFRTSKMVFQVDNVTSDFIINQNLGAGILPMRSLHVKDVLRLEPISTSPTSPSEGDMYMNSTTHKLMVYDGTIWQACW